MAIKFKQSIPNELYINNFSENKTLELTYDGPEELIVAIGTNDTIIGIVDAKLDPVDPDVATVTYVDVVASENPEVAYYLYNTGKPYEYTHVEKTTFDNVIYKEISNPRSLEYFQLIYTSGELTPWTFNVIKRRRETTVELSVINDKTNLISNLKNIGLTEDLQVVYDTYLLNVDNWLNDAKKYDSWKYIEMPLVDTAPKLPLSLIKLVNEIKSYKE